MPKYKKSRRHRRGRHTRHTRRRHTQKKQIHMKMKMKGGTKVFVREGPEPEHKWRFISENKDIAQILLKNITSISEISSGSLCSMILKGDLDPEGNIKIQSQVYHADGKPTNPTDRANRPRKINIGLQFHNVCMKITLIKNGSTEISSIPWNTPLTKTINKEVLSIEECEKEFEVQRLMYQQLLCGEIANEIIADGIATIKLSPEEFKTFYSPTQSKPPQSEQPQSEPPKYDSNVNKILDWVYTSAHDHNLQIHIAFMDNLEMYVPSSKIDRHTHRYYNKYHDIGIALILIVLMTTGIPYDFHEGNVLIHRSDKKIKCVDFGRMHFLSNPDIETVLTMHLKTCLKRDIIKHFLKFFNVSNKDDIVSKFVLQLKQIIKYSNEKYTFYSLDITEQRKRVYEILVFVAFVDIITNLSLYSPRVYFQSLWLIKNIFLFNADALMTTESVLNTFCITYDDFLRIHTDQQVVINFINKTFNPVLTYMSDKLKQSIVMCKNPKRQTSTSFREGPDSDMD